MIALCMPKHCPTFFWLPYFHLSIHSALLCSATFQFCPTALLFNKPPSKNINLHMASMKLNYQEPKLCRKIKPALLKDYLLDDLSSCSSNGFKSFPRLQCCTTVRFLLDRDLKLKPSISPAPSRRHGFNKTRPPATTSVFQKASEAVLNAVKLLSIHKRSTLSPKSGFLARSFSRKVFKWTFWKKRNVDGQIHDGEIHHWKTFHNLISEFPETPPHWIPITSTTTPTTAATTNTTDSKDSSKSSSWSENEFTSEVRSGGSSSADKEKDWIVKDEKEQFSPVSVLESPFDVGDGDDASPADFDSKLVESKGSKKMVMKRHHLYKTLAEMEPINLEKRLDALSEIGRNEIIETTNFDSEKAQTMLERVKSIVETKSTFFAGNLLLDFFMDTSDGESDHELSEEALCYLTGKEKEMGIDWRVEASRKWYIKDMEKGGAWKDVEDQRIDSVKEIERGIWGSLLDELMSELEVD